MEDQVEEPAPPDIAFSLSGHTGTELLRITPEAFIYKGEIISDAGEAHRVFMEVLTSAKTSYDRTRIIVQAFVDLMNSGKVPDKRTVAIAEEFLRT